MKTKIALIGIVILSALLFLGCTESEKTNYQEPSENDITNEIDNTWENEGDINAGTIIDTPKTEEIPDETINEDEDLSIGEMI